MLENFETISELDAKRQEYSKAVARYCEPLLQGIEFMDDLYRAAQNGYYDPVEERRAFIFAVLFFYSPKKLLTKERCRSDIMRKMCELTQCSQSLVSHDSRDLLFLYNHYWSLRNLVDITLEKSCRLLEERGVHAKLYITRFGNEKKEKIGQEKTY